MRVLLLVVVLIFGVTISASAMGSSSREELNKKTEEEKKNNDKGTTVLVGMSEKQKEGFERTWRKTQPRWEAEEKARSLEKQKLFQEAIEAYKKAISFSEADFYSETSHRALARLYEKTGQYDAAVKELEWLIERFRKMNYPNKKLLNEYEEARSRLLKRIGEQYPAI